MEALSNFKHSTEFSNPVEWIKVKSIKENLTKRDLLLFLIAICLTLSAGTIASSTEDYKCRRSNVNSLPPSCLLVSEYGQQIFNCRTFEWKKIRVKRNGWGSRSIRKLLQKLQYQGSFRFFCLPRHAHICFLMYSLSDWN